MTYFVSGGIQLSQSTHEFQKAFCCKFVPVSYGVCDIARYWLKMADFKLLLLYLAPLLRVTP